MGKKNVRGGNIITVELAIGELIIINLWLSRKSRGLTILGHQFYFDSTTGKASCWCGVTAATGWRGWSPEPLCAEHLGEWRRQMSEDIYLRGDRSAFAYLGDWRLVAP